MSNEMTTESLGEYDSEITTEEAAAQAAHPVPTALRNDIVVRIRELVRALAQELEAQIPVGADLTRCKEDLHGVFLRAAGVVVSGRAAHHEEEP